MTELLHDVFRYVRRNYFILLSVAVVGIGTLGYRLIEGVSWLDAFYTTCITVSTVGFREVQELSAVGKLFTVALIVAGLSTVVVAVGQIGQDMIALTARRYKERMEKQVEALSGHYILCGYGRMGRVIARHLQSERVPFVVVDHTPELVEAIREEKLLAIEGDATSDETLERAGVRRAKGLVTVLSKDAENVFVVLTASQLNPSLYILARANNDDAIPKLIRAGANAVINPYESAGARIAQTLLRPAVTDFMQVVTSREGLDILVEQIEIQPESQLAGRTLRESNLRQVANAMVVAIRKGRSGEMLFNPESSALMEAGDTLIAIASKQALDRLAEMARSSYSS
ncbi:Potassium channel protein [Candidatus Sumerlaea chitinivorans]|uniref:Potassium channel protein n=1 Tax=Sumerlaea chitinivorans TaxID=2250252 RepID=A0A2Z4Y2X5_SUMC1|nr:Potassium channel protein [Candidatus Sumerlaea chitinivorans]